MEPSLHQNSKNCLEMQSNDKTETKKALLSFGFDKTNAWCRFGLARRFLEVSMLPCYDSSNTYVFKFSYGLEGSSIWWQTCSKG